MHFFKASILKLIVRSGPGYALYIDIESSKRQDARLLKFRVRIRFIINASFKKNSKTLNPLPLYYKLLISMRVTCENQIMLTRKRYISARGINPGFCPCNVALLTASAKSSVYTLYI